MRVDAGAAQILEQVVTKQNPGTPHNTDGWPTFEGWPTHSSLTHEQVYYKWMERAWLDASEALWYRRDLEAVATEVGRVAHLDVGA